MLRSSGRLLLAAYFAAASLILVGRYWLMPEIDRWRPAIEQQISRAIGLPVEIGELSADWPGLHPHLVVGQLRVHDRTGREALLLERVEAEIGWTSLLFLEPRLHRLEIFAPVLEIRRDAAGNLFVAGLPVRAEGDSRFTAWLLEQYRIVVREARVVWRDELRAAPPLELSHLDFVLHNLGHHHDFALVAVPSGDIAASIDLRGKVSGRSLSDLSGWDGQLYLDAKALDIAAAAPWVTLPLEMTQGRGDVRLWLDLADAQPSGATADLRLADLRVRLQPDLPPLAMTHLDGRLIARRTKEGYAGELRRFRLATVAGIELPVTDASLRLKAAGGGGELIANRLELDQLVALMAFVPVPQPLRERLEALAPRGRLRNLEVAWQGALETPQSFRIRGDFSELSLAAWKTLPGFGGISGHVDGDHLSGRLTLAGSDARLELPAVFPEPTLALGRLEAEIGWRAKTGATEFLIQRASFSNDDAKGEALGSYRYTGEGPGEIDLTAKLTDAAGSAVWRYLPRVVSKDARDWLKASIRGGRAENTTLRLKGPLAQFPFRGGKGGIFQVRGRFHGVGLDYAPGWPAIDGIDGELLFENERMVIHGQRAAIMGVALSEVRAEIPDLEALEERLIVTGRAQGDTQRFFDFIEASPVGERIDHFTADMAAQGTGTLDLKLVIPLRHTDKTEVQGRYRFAGNRIEALAGLPAFTEAQGELTFSTERLQAKNLRARFLDQPVTIEIATQSGGAVRIAASGGLAANALRRHYGWPALDHLSGETPWRGVLTVKKTAAELRLESDLRGLASSLPEPLNKPGLEALPLLVEGRLEPQRGQWSATLGRVARLVLQRANAPWRGRLSIGEKAVAQASPLPAQGLALAADLARIDADAWRVLVKDGTENGSDGALAVTAIEVRSPVLRALRRDFHEARLSGTRNMGRWQLMLSSREVQGDLIWEMAGAGRISGHFSRLHLPAIEEAVETASESGGDTTRELPALDLAIDSFRVGEKAFGELRLAAENRAGTWQGRFELKNDAAKLSGEGRWRPGRAAAETALDFKLDVGNAEKLLQRLKLPDAVRRGEGKLSGDVRWRGSPLSFDLKSLAGSIEVDFGTGQFKKLEPGVGRLLGVLSLQALPRRITLDFRDIFSEGFAFDRIGGAARIARGVMATDELRIQGPAAKVSISGQIDLVTETQQLKVRVQPAIGESLAVGAMLAHPVAGAVAWAAQKILKDPLDQIFAYEYAVRGSWSDPQVEKLTHKAPDTPPITPGSTQ
ncbi:YhdP family protein [Sulfuricystis multivorans]|uniref:YhdP family protein n=1 Tax=Sulfuricystis multivorans TaxID=2211108 RepID=UPI001558FA63|nr:YhdP family protein [Sulfuricystis multivorans]